MKKIGILCLALVIALGALGVGYAAWTDQITIHGTVNTGSVDIEAEYFSGTDIYKDTDPQSATYEDAIVVFWVKDANGDPVWSTGAPPSPGVLVASAAAAPGAGAYDVEVTVTNAFPYAYLTADCIIHCVGSVPVIVTASIDTTDPMLIWLWENDYAYFSACEMTIGPGGLATGDFSFGDPITGPFQLHQCEYAKFWLYLDLPQEAELVGTPYTQADFMGKNWSFTASFDAIQWNEYQP